MKVKIRLFPPFSQFYGRENITVELEGDVATVEQVVNKIQSDNADFYEKLREHNVLKDNKPDAIIVLDGQLATFDSMVKDQSIIKLLYPMCGG